MELININIICFQIFKALFQILKQLLSPCGSGLCGNEKLIPDLFKGKPQFMLTVTIGSCRIKKRIPPSKALLKIPTAVSSSTLWIGNAPKPFFLQRSAYFQVLPSSSKTSVPLVLYAPEIIIISFRSTLRPSVPQWTFWDIFLHRRRSPDISRNQ